jgi:hypothetical protein
VHNILTYKINENQDNTGFLYHPLQNGYHQENKQKQMMVRMQGEEGKMNPLHTVGGNVN